MADSVDLLHCGREILTRMVAMSKNVTIYPPNHPMIKQPATEICELLKPLFAGQPRVSFDIVNSDIYFKRQLLREESIQYSDFIRLLLQYEINSLYFEPEVSPGSIATFFAVIHEAGKKGLNQDYLKTRLNEERTRGICFEKLVSLEVAESTYRLVQEEEISSVARASYEQATEYMKGVEKDVLAKKHIDTNQLQSVVSSLASDFLTDRDAVLEILNIKNYDEFLFSHSINVAIVSLLIASKLSLEEGLMKTVGIAGLLHDIGKVKIPRELINKPEQLSENEWIVVRRHPIEGAQILVRHENIGELPVLAALEHHAGYDLSGYPTLKGKKRPHAVARIVTIADVYEAMTANRSYRSARTICHTVKLLIDGSGRQFDPLLVKLLLNTIGAFPPGSMVRLKNGAKAVVVEPNVGHPFSPKVRIIGARTSDLKEAPLIDTAEDPAQYAVVGVADSEEV